MRTIQHSFAAGEFSPEVQGRSDLDRYDLGAVSLQNFVVKYGGGIEKRRGTYFAEFLQYPQYPIRQFAFKFSSDVKNTYSIIFGFGYIRFMRNAGYVLENPIAVESITAGNVSAPGHGFSEGDWVYLSASPNVVEVRNVSATTFNAYDIFGDRLTTLGSGAGTASRVFSLSNPYAPEDFADIAYSQEFDKVKFTHPDYPVWILERTATGWTMLEEVRNSGRPRPQTPIITDSGAYIQHIRMLNDGGDMYNQGSNVIITDPTGSGFKGEVTIYDTDNIAGVNIIHAGKSYTNPVVTFSDGNPADPAEAEAILSPTDAGFIMAVSAIFADGTESGITRPAIVRNSIDFSSTKGSATYSWQAIPEAVSYNVYRSLILPDGDDIHLGYLMGYIGNSKGTEFTDNNIVPDFTRTPKLYRDPFADAALLSVEVINPGSGYSSHDTLALSGGGSGFVGYPIVKDNKIVGAYIAHHGSGYDAANATLTVVSAGGSGATFSLTFSPATGNYPATSFKFQRRYGYAGTKNNPMTVWASREKILNFSESIHALPGDPYQYDMDSDEIAPIRHAIPVKAGLMLFTALGVALLRGGDGKAVTATEGYLDPQSYVGASTMRPTLVEEDIAYVQEKYRGVQLLSFEGNSRQYQGEEISILARHLFEDGREVRSLCFSWQTDKTGYGIFADGTAFALTIQREQEMYAFTPISTRGNFHDAVSLAVNGAEEHISFQVERRINKHQLKMIEVMRPRSHNIPEEFLHLDSALVTPRRTPAARVMVSDPSGTVTVTASAPVFDESFVGRQFGAGGGRGLITTLVSPTEVIVDLVDPIYQLANESPEPRTFLSGEWYANPIRSELTNIPFEQERVQIVVDGEIQPSQVVIGGKITLAKPGAIIQIGQDFTAKLMNLSPTSSSDVVEFARKTVKDVGLKLGNAGPFQINGYDAQFRPEETWFAPEKLKRKGKLVAISGDWDITGQFELVSKNGLPLEIYQVVYNVAVGN